MAVRLNDALRNDLIDVVMAKLDGGLLQIWSGAQVPSVADSPTGTLLAEITLPVPAFARSATPGVIELAGSWQTEAVGTGRAGWARFRSADDVFRIDCGIGTNELSLDNTSISAEQAVQVVSFTVTMPGE